MDRFAFLYNCAMEIQTHFTNTFKNELTRCLKNKLLKIQLNLVNSKS